MIHQKTYNKKEFVRSQVAAFLGTAVDYLITLGLTEIAGLWYIYSNIVGATLGAVTNFLLGRYWAFMAEEGRITSQVIRYGMVSGGSLALNTLGLYLLTEFGSLNYILSKIIVGVSIAVTYNYLMQKFFVFRKK